MKELSIEKMKIEEVVEFVKNFTGDDVYACYVKDALACYAMSDYEGLHYYARVIKYGIDDADAWLEDNAKISESSAINKESAKQSKLFF